MEHPTASMRNNHERLTSKHQGAGKSTPYLTQVPSTTLTSTRQGTTSQLRAPHPPAPSPRVRGEGRPFGQLEQNFTYKLVAKPRLAPCGCRAVSNGSLQLRQRYFAVAIEHVVGTERNDVAGGENVVRATFHDPAHIEVVYIEKRCDGNAQ